MGILAFLKPKVDTKIEAAMSTVKDASADLSNAIDRLDRIVSGNIERTINRTLDENARLSGRKRQ